ncbi:MAG: tetraacyldisaccharide 4'-kinase, partial [Armatimonadota bacterium]|nr:tetraacyldisaccharide 4'-kinase [Armatimonadota bacterium]
ALDTLRQKVRRLAPAATLAEARRVPERLWNLAGDECLPLTHLRHLPVVALSAIGNPHGFEALLQSLGARVHPARLPDHHHYTPRDLERAVAFARRRGAAAIVTTDKDAVKVAALSETARVERAGMVEEVPFLVLSIRLHFLRGEETLRAQVLEVARRSPVS